MWPPLLPAATIASVSSTFSNVVALVRSARMSGRRKKEKKNQQQVDRQGIQEEKGERGCQSSARPGRKLFRSSGGEQGEQLLLVLRLLEIESH